MPNPKQVNYKLPTSNADGTPLAVSDIKQVNIGIRPANGTAGVYPITVPDITFTADQDGISHEPLSAFGTLAFGDYVAAAQTVTKAGGTSLWSPESAVFTLAAPVPNPPSAVSVS